MSTKKFIVDLSDEERQLCQEVVKKIKGTNQKVKRANILLKADKGCVLVQRELENRLTFVIPKWVCQN